MAFGNAGQIGFNNPSKIFANILELLGPGAEIIGPDFIINMNGAFWYSGTPAFGNLILSIASSGGNDAFGNPYEAGLEPTEGSIPGSLLQLASVPASAVDFSATDIGGITTYVGSIEPSGDINDNSLWIDTASNNALYQYSGGAWTLYQFGPGAVDLTATELGGINTYVQAAAPTGAINPGSLWIDTSSGNAIYQYESGAWTLYQFGSGSIAANSISAAQMVANTITAAQIAAGAIGTNQLAANAVTAAKIAANTITAAQIAANVIGVGQLVAGLVYAGIVNGTTIQAAQFVAYGTDGEILIYSGVPANGNLISSDSAEGGTDSYENTYVAGKVSYDSVGAYVQIHTADITFNSLTSALEEGPGIQWAGVGIAQLIFGSGLTNADDEESGFDLYSLNSSPIGKALAAIVGALSVSNTLLLPNGVSGTTSGYAALGASSGGHALSGNYDDGNQYNLETLREAWYSDQVISGTGYNNVTVTGWSVAAQQYRYRFLINYSTTASAGTPSFDVNAPADSASSQMITYWPQGTAGNSLARSGTIGNLGVGPTLNGNGGMALLEGVATFTAAGTLYLKAKTSSGSDQFTVLEIFADLIPLG